MKPILYLILIPLIGVLIILIIDFSTVNNKINNSSITNFNQNKISLIKFLNKLMNVITPSSQNFNSLFFIIALFFSLLNLFISMIMWYFFDNFTLNNSINQGSTEINSQFQFILEINHFTFGVDGISLFFILLTTFITPIAIFSSYELFVKSKVENNHLNVTAKTIEVHNENKVKVIEPFNKSSNVAVTSIASTETLQFKATQGHSEGGIIKDNTSSFTHFASEGEEENQKFIKLKVFLISLLLLESLQICAFVSLDLLLFYVFFESVK
jgi:NADH:ubiquinone oxidoreductase subunit 4 (subunit M)